MHEAFRMRKASAFPASMNRRVGTLLIESVTAESPKFTAPMLFLHGLWCTAVVWRRFMGYLAHRGWSCHALNLRGYGGSGSPARLGQVRFADYLEDVRLAIGACEAQPVLLGHDLGALLALHCASVARAVVAVAPIVPQPLRSQPHWAFGSLRACLARFRAGPLPPPRGKLALRYFGSCPPEASSADSAAVERELSRTDLRFPVTSDVPILVVAGEADVVSPVRDVERLATYAGATFQLVQGAGHGLPWNSGWQGRVGDIHRWLVQQLGESLLAMREEEEDE
jgi:pimeloyl-ACP methyl ester carboxylesterase